jgi:hypothetical protein
MSARRQTIRRLLEIWALAAAIVACVISGQGASMVAAATPIVLNPDQFKTVPVATAQILAMVPNFPAYGWAFAVLIGIAALATFKLTRDEDIRLQVILFVSLGGCAVAASFWWAVGVTLVLLPHVANGL